MIVSELISKLNQMVSTGEIAPDSEVTISAYDNKDGNLLEDMDIRGVNWFYLNPDEVNDDSNKVLSIEVVSTISM